MCLLQCQTSGHTERSHRSGHWLHFQCRCAATRHCQSRHGQSTLMFDVWFLYFLLWFLLPKFSLSNLSTLPGNWVCKVSFQQRLDNGDPTASQAVWPTTGTGEDSTLCLEHRTDSVTNRRTTRRKKKISTSIEKSMAEISSPAVGYRRHRSYLMGAQPWLSKVT